MFKEYLEIKKQIDELQKKKLDLEIALYKQFQEKLDEKEEGTISIVDNNYKLSVTKKLKITVDNDMADAIGFGFKKKYTFDKKAYKELDDEKKKLVDECLTTAPAKPSFKVELINGD